MLFSCWCLVYTTTNLTNLDTPEFVNGPVLCIIISSMIKCMTTDQSIKKHSLICLPRFTYLPSCLNHHTCTLVTARSARPRVHVFMSSMDVFSGTARELCMPAPRLN